MRVIGLAGWSGAGKTTLVLKLIPELNRRGLTVSTLKHAHHAFEIDEPGKDSFEHRAAGAEEVLVASERRFALIRELRGAPEPSLAELLARLAPVDLVIVEGFKQLQWLRRVEVFRGAGEALVLGDPGIAAVALPAGLELQGYQGVKLPLDDLETVLDFILSD